LPERSQSSTAKSQDELGLKNVTSLGIVSMFTDISTEMILGVLPYFVITELGATKALLGLMEGTAEFLSNIFRVFSGMISDRVGRRKPLVLLGYGLSTLAKPFFALATSWTDAFIVRLADRVGKGIRTSPRDALISESVKERKSGRAFGLHRSADQVGAIAGPTLAFLLLPAFGIRGLFWLSLVPGFLSLAVLLFFVRDRRGVGTSTNVLANAKTVLTRKFSAFLAVMAIFALGAYNFSFVLVKAGSLGIDSAVIPLVYATLNIATVATGLPAGILADRYGREKLLMVGFGIFFASSLAGLLVGQGAWLAFPIAFIFGAYTGFSDTLQRALVPSFVAKDLKGTAYAVYYLVIAVCSLVANLVFGTLWDQVSMSAAFIYSLTMSFLAIVGMLALVIARSKNH
jgi:MFS family permease